MIFVILKNRLFSHVAAKLSGQLLFCNNHEIHGKCSYIEKILSFVFMISGRSATRGCNFQFTPSVSKPEISVFVILTPLDRSFNSKSDKQCMHAPGKFREHELRNVRVPLGTTESNPRFLSISKLQRKAWINCFGTVMVNENEFLVQLPLAIFTLLKLCDNHAHFASYCYVSLRVNS